jgi:polyisoprenoid-binding protein YceI
MTIKSFILAIFLFPAFAFSADLTKPIVVKTAALEFIALGKPSLIKIRGKSQALTGTIISNGKTLSGKIKLEVKTLDSGIELRDKHMKEKYLEVQKYPEAILTVKDLPALESGKDLNQEVQLPLYLHGVERMVKVNLQLKNHGEKYTGTASFSISLSDYKLDIPTYMGIKVADQVNLSVNFEASR